MFELEDFDLDDEVFLNTQMPTDLSGSSIKSSSSTLILEDNDRTLLDVSNAVFEPKSTQNQSIELENKSMENENKNKYDLYNGESHNTLIAEHKLEKTKPFSECQSNTSTFNFDDGFDSDDEAFFNTPDVIGEQTKDSAIGIINKNHNESLSSFKCENYTPKCSPSNIKSSKNLNNYDHLNTTVTSVKTMTPKCASRKFPGPAGLLSENDNFYSEDPSNLESLDMSINITDNDKKEENLCTQANDFAFSSSPYQQFLSDFFTTDADVLLDKYNVAWIKQKLLPYTVSGRSFTDKIPFFVSVIKEIDCLSPDPTVVLADKTGHIRGTIHRIVWNQFSSQLKLGSVVVLSKVGISCQKIVKSFTLNITSDHLMAIYSFSLDNVEDVIVTRTTSLSNEDIVNDAKRWNSFNVDNLSKTPHFEIRSRINGLNNLKSYGISIDQNTRLSNVVNDQTADNHTPARSTHVKSVFKPKTSVANNLLNNFSRNVPEEPPTKRVRNEECKSKCEERDVDNEMFMIQNMFEGINEDEMFDDFCC